MSEGYLNTLLKSRVFSGRDMIDFRDSGTTLEDFFLKRLNPQLYTPQDLLVNICNLMQIPVDVIVSKNRTRDVVLARHIFVTFALIMFPDTGHEYFMSILNKDRTTFYHMIQNIRNILNPLVKDNRKSYIELIAKTLKTKFNLNYSIIEKLSASEM